MRSLLYVNIQFEQRHQLSFKLDAYTQANECGQRTVRNGGIEFNPDYVNSFGRRFTNIDAVLIDDIQLLQRLRFLRILYRSEQI